LNRLQKVLEDANIKLASVASDILGMSGRLMLEAILAGERDPACLANLAQGRLRAKIDALVEALTGRVHAHQLFLLEQQLGHFDFLCQQIETISQKIARQLTQMDADNAADSQRTTPAEQSPMHDESERTTLTYAQALELLDTIPGVNRRTAEIIIAELGIDMSRFPMAKHAASWCGVAPGNHESAGKRQSGKSTGGNQFLKSALTEAAWAASHAKQTYLHAQYHRLVARRGKKRALLAVAHSILVITYHLLKERTPYRDLGAHYFDERKQATVLNQLVRRIKNLGFDVELSQVDAVPAV
jgi:transposase